MRLQELAKAATNAINQAGIAIGKYRPKVIIKMRSSKHESKTRRLIPGGHCPIGEVISRLDDGDVVAFDAVDLLAWCVARSNGVEAQVWKEGEA